jgi:hypothetical protein
MEIQAKEKEGYADIAATWEVKPMSLWNNQETFEHKVERPTGTILIYPPKDFETEFRDYPQQSELKYACIPSRTKAYFIYNNQKIYDCAREIPQIIKLKKLDITANTPSTSKQTKYWGYDILDIVEPHPDYDYYCHIDFAVSDDTAIMGIGHGEPFVVEVTVPDEDGEIGRTLLTQKVVIDQLIEWVPDNQHLVSSLNVDEVLNKLDAKLKFRYIQADSWNSQGFLEKVARKGKKAGQHNVNNKDYFLLRALIHAEAIIYPKSDILITELEKLIWTGKRVEHTIHSGKDRADALAGLSMAILSGLGEKRQKFTFSF